MKPRMKALSRRRFFGAALAGGLAVPIARGDSTHRAPVPSTSTEEDKKKLEALLRTYGSELGSLRKAR